MSARILALLAAVESLATNEIALALNQPEIAVAEALHALADEGKVRRILTPATRWRLS